MSAALQSLLALMAKLRDPDGGCPWDRAQDFHSIAPYTIEEAYEVAEAIAEGPSPEALRDELGDLLFQVVFHARMAEERGWFDFEAVAQGICSKLQRRHPHVFGQSAPGSAAELTRAWEQSKAEERAARGQVGQLGEVPRALPALSRAAKLGRRAGRVGFDWPEASGVRAKVIEELAETDAALASGAGTAAVREEIGDLMFALANWARHLHIDPEEALRQASRKFERRFARMEQLAARAGLALEQLDGPAWERLWEEAKRG